MPPHVRLIGVSRFYPAGNGKLHALGPVDLNLRKGEFFAVVGPSGCGKSTLLEMISALALPTDGAVEFEGRPIGNSVPEGVGIVFQENACFPWLSGRGQYYVRAAAHAGESCGDRSAPAACPAVDGARGIRRILPRAVVGRHAPARMHRAHAGDAAAADPAR